MIGGWRRSGGRRMRPSNIDASAGAAEELFR